MLFNVMMAVGILPVLLIMYVVLKRNAKPVKNRYFSVTFRPEWLEVESCKQKLETVTKQYDKNLLVVLIVSMAVPLTGFLTPYVSIQLMIWLLWLFVALALFYLPFGKANAVLRKYKEEMGWNIQAEREVHVELKSLGQVRRVRVSQFVLPFLVTALTVGSAIGYRVSGRVLSENPVNEMCFYVFWITFLLCIVLFAVFAIAMDKKGTDVISKDSDVNLNYTRAKKNVWRSFWQWSAWLTVALQVVIAVALWFESAFMDIMLWGTMIYTVVIIVMSLRIANKLSSIDKNYADKKNEELFVDDDRYWIGGIIYYNPSDKRSMVETRIGVGFTTNMARPLGWILDIIGLASILLCIGMCGWIIVEEFTPIDLVYENQCIKAEHIKTEYEILVSEIEEITCLEELPKMSKSNGSAIDKMYKGTFFISEEERKCKVFLNPQNNMFLRVKTEGGIYYMSGIDDEQTKEVYDLIVK